MTSKGFLFLALFTFVISVVLLAPGPLRAGAIEQLWSKVQKADNEGLPKTAIEHLDDIVRTARAKKNYPWLLKALTARWTRRAQTSGNVPKERILLAEKEIGKADKRVRPLLHTVLATWYWHYYLQNRWRFKNRTATKGLDDKDFTTWDLPKLFKRIGFHYEKALRPKKWLGKMQLSLWKPFLEGGGAQSNLRFTLFDFIGHEALNFYESGEQPTSKSFDAYEMDCNSGVFAPTREFINFKPDTGDDSSPLVKAISLYQSLLSFHEEKGNVDAVVDLELRRLQFVRNKSIGGNKDDKYLEALEQLCNDRIASPVITMAYWKRALVYKRRNELVTAMKIARKGASLHSNSIGAKNCKSVINNIEQKALSFTTERTVRPGTGTIAIDYKNITEVHLRVYRDRWDHFLRDKYTYTPDNLNEKTMQRLLDREQPLHSWKVSLEPTKDYRNKKVIKELPKLKKGFYRIIASWKSDFSDRRKRGTNSLHASSLWVSNITLITRTRSGQIEGFVLDATTGEPIAGADVVGYSQSRRKWEVAKRAVTDSQGCYSLSHGRGLLVVAHKNGHRSAQSSQAYSYNRGSSSRRTRVAFFTDRAIYRPGQKIQYKGIVYETHHGSDRYAVMPNVHLKVTLYDRNSQKVADEKVQANEFGSFSGTFKAPSGVLTGRMTIRSTPYSGSASLRVEEYKRPKFIVTVDKPKDGGQLGRLVKVKGHAKSYTGAPIDGAKVRYRITRQVRWPYWCSFWWSPPASQSQEIAHGVTKTSVDGSFNLSFEAKPDNSVDKKNDPSFNFSVKVDVIDQTGETRTGSTSVRLGYKAMEARLSAGSWLTATEPMKVNVSTTTLDGQPVGAKGTVEIYALKQPKEPVPKMLYQGYYRYYRRNSRKSDPSNWQSWQDGKKVKTLSFATAKTGMTTLNTKLPAGPYRARLKSKDRYGKEVVAFLPFLIVDPRASKFAVKVPNQLSFKSTSVEVGGTLEALWGTGYQSGRAFVEIEHRGKLIKRMWTKPGKTQYFLRMPIAEKFRGGFILHFTYVRDNRQYTNSRKISVPWTNKDIKISFESFRSLLKPNQKETWVLKLEGKEAKLRAAEMVATLYDTSLDTFARLNWPTFSNLFRQDNSYISVMTVNRVQNFSNFKTNWNTYMGTSAYSYWRFPGDVTAGWHRFGRRHRYSRFKSKGMPMTAARAPMARALGGAMPPPAPGGMMAQTESLAMAADKSDGGPPMDDAIREIASSGPARPEPAPEPDLEKVTARKNLAETAFFKPHLKCDAQGRVTITFQAPETLTKWSLLGFAHSYGLESGRISGNAVTRKDLMVRPTAPRFLREKDQLQFSAKVVNMSDKEQRGKVRLTLRNASTDQNFDRQLANVTTDQSFAIPAGQSKAFFWKLNVPVGAPPLAYKVVASSGRHSDGEENFLPVLSGRVFVTESMPLPIRGPKTKKFKFKKLLASANSKTLTHHAITVQAVSNPAWYAVQALPYLMEYPHECSEQVFNRLYANAIARHIANSDRRIRKVFDQWKGTDALKSNLQKNQDLKSVLLKETPWVLQAKSEEQAKNNVGILFDQKRLTRETKGAIKKLGDMQLSSGAWPWFPGGRANDFITLYVMTGFGRLKHLEVEERFPRMNRCLSYCDNWMKERYDYIVRHGHLKHNNLSSTIALYLYGRSFFLGEQKVASQCQKALQYFLQQAKKHWLKQGQMSQGHLAIALGRYGDTVTPKKIVRSLREKATISQEMGMSWDDEISWWWYRAPIETQAVMIEVFHEVAKDKKAVDACQTWLLKQKQTQHWRTTKATADAVYALLMRGRNLLASTELVQVKLGSLVVKPDKVEAGTGYYEKRFAAPEVKADMGNITMKKVDEGVAWGSVHWQYFEDLDKVTPHKTPLQLEKTLFVQRQTATGPVIEPVKGQDLHPGDLVKVRIVLRVDRAMEYVHLKDHRGSGTEPTNVLSHYKYQDGLAYYEATGDTATNFFIDYLPKGTYVFEYPVRVIHNGRYQSGMASIQCMYAPEFNSHSGSVTMTVTPE